MGKASDSKTVLLAEDDALIAMGVSQAIHDGTGLDVLVVPTVAAAIKEVQKGRIVCAFLDVNLRKETTFDLARQLAADGIPFAFMSGAMRDGIPDDLRSARFLTKPFRMREIIEIVRSALPPAATALSKDAM